MIKAFFTEFTSRKLFTKILYIWYLYIKFIIFWIGSLHTYAQKHISSVDALKKHKELNIIFKETFTEDQHELFLTNYFQQLELIPFIEGNYEYKLKFYSSKGLTILDWTLS